MRIPTFGPKFISRPLLAQARAENILAAYRLAYRIIDEKGPITQRAVYDETQKEFHPPPHKHQILPTETFSTHKTSGIHIVQLPPAPPNPDHLIKSYKFLKEVLRDAEKNRKITKLSKQIWAKLHGEEPPPLPPRRRRGEKHDREESTHVWITMNKYNDVLERAKELGVQDVPFGFLRPDLLSQKDSGKKRPRELAPWEGRGPGRLFNRS
jgi:hypothetical protein